MTSPSSVNDRLKELSEREMWHRWQAEIFGLIAINSPQSTILERITVAMEELVRDAIASVVLLEADGCIHHAAAPHLPAGFVQACDGEPIGPIAGSCGTAMFRGERVIVSDIANDPLWAPYRDLALEHGLRACWSTPVKSADGRVMASFALYYRQCRTPSETELSRVDRIVDLVAVTLKHHRAIESLRESEEKFRQLADTIDQVFWMRDPEVGKMFYINPAYETIWGHSCQSLYDNPMQWIDCIHEDDRARVLATVQAHPDRAYEVEYRIVRPDGEVRWILDRGFPVVESDGTVARIVGTAADLTRQKQVEWALRQSESRFQAISMATSDVLWDWNLETGSIWWSDDLENLVGRTPAEVPDTRAWIGMIHPQDRERVLRENESSINGGDAYWAGEYRMLHRDGRVVHVEDRGCVIRDESGKPLSLVGGLSDVTARKHQQTALRERIKELGCLYEVLNLTHDQDRTVEDVCQAIADILSGSLFHDEFAVARVVLEGQEYRSTHWQPPESSLSSGIRVENARAGFVEVGYLPGTEHLDDGDDPFLAEEEKMIEAVATHIGRMVETRRMASRITRIERLKAIGELTGGIAHDFNNLLTVILGNAELMSRLLPEDHRAASLAKMTTKAALRGAELTNHLLAFARRQSLSPSPTDVDGLLRGMRPLLTRTLGEHVRLSISCQADTWRAMVDPGQLESAILNLCINARDAMPNGGPLVVEVNNAHLDTRYADLQEDLEAGDYVMVAVSDAGVGMGEEVMRNAFEPFFTTKDVGEGSGLGLSMVYGFAKQSRGHVRIYSESGQGTTVKLYLPRAADRDRAQPPEAEEQHALPRGSERILLVEDDEMVRQNAAEQLGELGYRVTVANNGDEALAILRRDGDFDLLFTDVVMPGALNGPALAREALALNPDLSVLFTSGYTEGILNRGVGPDPVHPVLAKPYRNRELALRVRQALSANHSR